MSKLQAIEGKSQQEQEKIAFAIIRTLFQSDPETDGAPATKILA